MNTENSSPFGGGGGLYIHIPFCKQACHYCDFHFSTSLGKKEAMIAALKRELELRKSEFATENVETIYFGGGTPSVLELGEIHDLVSTVYKHYKVADTPEITLEANPDDLSLQKIQALAKSPINRLSLGIQSFFDTDLKLMNRAHSADEASESLKNAVRHFDNISIDLIYGMPDMTLDRWKKNIEKALSYGVPHISSYALTIEPKTALANFVDKGLIRPASDELAQEHFHLLYETLLQEGFICYEISNFGKPGYFSQNNSAYWQQKKYVGIGPSAHSFDGIRRGWNIGNNPKYIKALEKGELPMETETLSTKDKYNEYVMTGLRTIWGVDVTRIQKEYGEKFKDYLLMQSKKFREEGLLVLEENVLSTTKKGKFLADGIAADLFMINLS
ncbi:MULTISPECIES: radical SAM family heme chaperone HemW [Maribacter]|uniref:Heme chaperone HemW n=1 Tax=Maribacter flavus TaxID=1658664 RepID=A0A5B2TY47_9FLAO|nr:MULTISPECIES: radical SAM family heme chaperone HemW [Maribacter]KAA2218755.1 radical SAM family heme chaperone HemW [Maribacter flavus]MDC6403712.1 radical SAM family heme chaperone HemW [Maribacter sp. PR66]MEE1970853.1 radical SAM family heme chaperone HemW [Maribacter flavus]